MWLLSFPIEFNEWLSAHIGVRNSSSESKGNEIFNPASN